MSLETATTSSEENHHPYVISADVNLIMDNWLDPFQVESIPETFWQERRRAMQSVLEEIFSDDTTINIVDSNHLREGMTEFARKSESKGPIVSLDRIYFPHGIPFNFTRLVGNDLNDIPEGSRTKESLENQYQRIHAEARGRGVYLLDDVIYSGNGIRKIIKDFNQHDLRVAGIISGISIGDSEEKILTDCTPANPGLHIHHVKHFPFVVDEICERDFYAGIPLSGRLLGQNGLPFDPEQGAPYFLPFAQGKLTEWSSIPEEHHTLWSNLCLTQSIELWKIVEELTGRKFTCAEIPRLPHTLKRNGIQFIDALQKLRG